MTAPWSMEVRVAGHSWTVTDLDPATVGPTAPLVMRHTLPDDQLWPSQPQPMSTTFGLVAASASDLGDVVEGADVHLGFTAGPNPEPVWFDGNVTDVEVQPARFRPDPDDPTVAVGVRLSVTAIGYLAQLWEEQVTLAEVPEPGEAGILAPERLLNLLADTLWEMSPPGGVEWILNDFPSYLGAGGMLAPLTVDGEAIGPHLDALFRVALWQDTVDDPLHRVIVEPDLDPVTRDLGNGMHFARSKAWKTSLVANTIEAPAAADLAATPTGWGVVVDADAGGNVIDAGLVEHDVRFVQRKRSTTTKVIVPYYDTLDDKPHALSASNDGRPTVTATLPNDGGDLPLVDRSISDATPDAGIRPIADFYLPAGHADAWGVETVAWRLDRDAPGRVPPALGALVVIAGIPETQNPNGRSWIAGIVKAWTLTLPDPVVELELVTARGVAVPDVTADRLTWADLPTGVTWAQLRPDHTWEDADLLRGTP